MSVFSIGRRDSRANPLPLTPDHSFSKNIDHLSHLSTFMLLCTAKNYSKLIIIKRAKIHFYTLFLNFAGFGTADRQ